jgi:hypothetical protein
MQTLEREHLAEKLDPVRDKPTELYGRTLVRLLDDHLDQTGEEVTAMKLPAFSQSEVYRVGKGFDETLECPDGSSFLVICRAAKPRPDVSEWEVMLLDEGNSENINATVFSGDRYCVVTMDQESVLVNRPSVPVQEAYDICETKVAAHQIAKFFNFVAMNEIDCRMVEAGKDLPNDMRLLVNP